MSGSTSEMKVVFFYVAVDLVRLRPARKGVISALFDESNGWRQNGEIALLCAMGGADLDVALAALEDQKVPEDLVYCGLEDGLDNLVLTHLKMEEQVAQQTPWLQVRRTNEGSWISRSMAGKSITEREK